MPIKSWQDLSGLFLNRSFRARYNKIKTARQWYQQLRVRIDCQALTTQMHQGLEPNAELICCIASALSQITENPFLDLSAPPFDSVYFLDGYRDAIGNGDKRYSHGIRRMTLHELFQIERSLPLAWSQEAQRAFRAPFPQSLGIERPQGLDEDVAPLDEFRVFLTLDPTLPVKLLQQQLEDLLTSLKREFQASAALSRFHKPDLDVWQEADLLPCIDLLLIAAALKIDIPRGGVARALLRGQKSNSKISQTTVPLAEALLHQTSQGQAHIRRLALMAATESR